MSAVTIVSSGDMSSNITGSSYNPASTEFTIQMTGTGSPVGYLEVEGSLDDSSFTPLAFRDQDGNYVNTIGVNGAFTHLVAIDIPGMDYVRVKYTSTSGTGTLNAFLCE